MNPSNIELSQADDDFNSNTYLMSPVNSNMPTPQHHTSTPDMESAPGALLFSPPMYLVPEVTNSSDKRKRKKRTVVPKDDEETGKKKGTRKPPPVWTEEDDRKLKGAVLLYGGKNWRQVAKLLDDRFSETQCLNRYKKVLNPNVIKGPWSEEEDQQLMQLVKVYGVKKWSKIASKMTGRISKQCRERWVNKLNPEINRGPWLPEEDKIIEDAHATFGNKWSKIVAELRKSGYIRADNSVKNHWNSTMRRERERRALIEQGIQPKKNRKYQSRKVSLVTAETPKNQAINYPKIEVKPATESNEALADQQRIQKETINGLLLPQETTVDYVSTLWDPRRPDVLTSPQPTYCPTPLHSHTNTTSTENATFMHSSVPPILKPNMYKRKRALDDADGADAKKRRIARVSSSTQLEVRDEATGTDVYLSFPDPSSPVSSPPAPSFALTDAMSAQKTLALCLSRLPAKLTVEKINAFKHPIFASAAHLIAQRRTREEMQKVEAAPDAAANLQHEDPPQQESQHHPGEDESTSVDAMLVDF